MKAALETLSQPLLSADPLCALADVSTNAPRDASALRGSGGGGSWKAEVSMQALPCEATDSPRLPLVVGAGLTTFGCTADVWRSVWTRCVKRLRGGTALSEGRHGTVEDLYIE